MAREINFLPYKMISAYSFLNFGSKGTMVDEIKICKYFKKSYPVHRKVSEIFRKDFGRQKRSVVHMFQTVDWNYMKSLENVYNNMINSLYFWLEKKKWTNFGPEFEQKIILSQKWTSSPFFSSSIKKILVQTIYLYHTLGTIVLISK